MKHELPLLVDTPEEWGESILKKPIELLNDHAHLERKAALNALDLLQRWPGNKPPAKWVRILSSVARDETNHLAAVVKIMKDRGAEMTRLHKNTYAQGLHKLIRMGKGPLELVDRLLASALIEARSCERFLILSKAASKDPVLSKLYKSLWGSEHGHYKVFFQLGSIVTDKEDVSERWQWFLEKEAEIVKSQVNGNPMHSWPC